MTSLMARWHRSIKEIPEQQWNSLVGDSAIPFYRWSWLEALESSGSIIPEQGWQPLHLALWRDDIPIAVAPLFLKGTAMASSCSTKPLPVWRRIWGCAITPSSWA